MRMKLWAAAAAIVSVFFAGQAGFAWEREAADRGWAFEGKYTSADWGTYLFLPFEVPEGTTIIKVKYDYKTDDGKPAVLDIGIHDPEKFRGWSSSVRKEFTVAESLEQTTDSYLAGNIPAGEWKIELGIPPTDPMTAFAYSLYGYDAPSKSSTVSWRVDVELSDEPVEEPFVMPPKQDVVISDQPGWYYGDLHCHSTHSDGKYPYQEVLDFAHAQGLDFIATTEHNSISHFQYLPEMQKLYPDMLILHGIEYTSYIGHANVFNYEHIMDFRAGTTGYDINEVIDEIHAGGGFFSPNHPASFLGAGIPFKVPGVDWSKVDFYEVVNGRTRVFNAIPNPLNEKAIKQWDALLRQGHRITAIGGSDDHEAGKGDLKVMAHIGMPTNVVYASALSTRGILDGLAAGRNYILTEGKQSGLKIQFTASGAGKTVMMGDAIDADEIEFRVTIDNAKLKTLVIVENGIPLYLPITSGHFDYTFTRKPRGQGYLRLEVKSGPFPEIVTNPIYYGAREKMN